MSNKRHLKLSNYYQVPNKTFRTRALLDQTSQNKWKEQHMSKILVHKVREKEYKMMRLERETRW